MIFFGAKNTQADVIDILPGEQSVSINPFLNVFYTSEELNCEQAISQIESGKMNRSDFLASPGFTTDVYWLRFDLKVIEPQDFILELDNPHLDHVQLYRLGDEYCELIGQGGDKHPFDYRTEKNRKYLFRLTPEINKPVRYLLMVDKRNASTSYPLRLWDEKVFEENENRMDLFYGVYFGMLLFISLFSLIIGVFLREGNFLSYSLYVLIVGLYIFTQLGFSFQYLYPGSSTFNNYSRVLLSFLLLVTSMDFFSRLLDVGHYLPRLMKVYRFMWMLLLGTLVFWVTNRIFNPDYARLTILTLNILYVVVIFFFGSVFYVVHKTWNIQRANVVMVMTAFFALMLGAIIYILVEYGVIPESYFKVNPMIIGSLIEVLILSVSMAYRVKVLNDRKNELTERLLRQQKEQMRAYIRGGDTERQRISAELHDNIGSALSLLKRKISQSNYDVKEVSGEIDDLCKDVRDLSHQLVPHQMHLVGFADVVGEYCKKFEKDSGIKVELDCFDLPELPGDVSTALLRIVQEATQNVLKHAQASLIEIQLLGYSDELVMTIDDNGVGFDKKSIMDGSGLLNMQNRAEHIHGTIEVSSHKGKGTNIIVSVPVRN